MLGTLLLTFVWALIATFAALSLAAKVDDERARYDTLRAHAERSDVEKEALKKGIREQAARCKAITQGLQPIQTVDTIG